MCSSDPPAGRGATHRTIVHIGYQDTGVVSRRPTAWLTHVDVALKDGETSYADVRRDGEDKKKPECGTGVQQEDKEEDGELYGTAERKPECDAEPQREYESSYYRHDAD
mgnify:CR=1 FL=1